MPAVDCTNIDDLMIGFVNDSAPLGPGTMESMRSHLRSCDNCALLAAMFLRVPIAVVKGDRAFSTDELRTLQEP